MIVLFLVVYLVVGVVPAIVINRWLHNTDRFVAAFAWLSWPMGLVTIVVYYLAGAIVFLMEKLGTLIVENR